MQELFGVGLAFVLGSGARQVYFRILLIKDGLIESGDPRTGTVKAGLKCLNSFAAEVAPSGTK